jgi:hypothetical protein
MYRAYGRVIESEVVLPELLPVHGAGRSDLGARPVSIAVRRGRAPFLPGARLGDRLSTGVPRGDTHAFCFGAHGTFWLSADGERIRCFLEGTDDRAWRHLLLDHALPRALSLLGIEALHATAVATDRGVVAFLGPTGSGKSTLAGALARRGHALFCDDCLGIESVGGSVIVVPGYPGLRLWSEAAHELFPRSIGVPLAESADKRRIVDPLPFCGERQSLRAAYVLNGERRDPPAAVRLEALPPADAVTSLLGSAFRTGFEAPARLRRQVGLLARVAEGVPVKRCVFPRDWSAIDGVADALLRDVGATPGAR